MIVLVLMVTAKAVTVVIVRGDCKLQLPHSSCSTTLSLPFCSTGFFEVTRFQYVFSLVPRKNPAPRVCTSLPMTTVLALLSAAFRFTLGCGRCRFQEQCVELN